MSFASQNRAAMNQAVAPGTRAPSTNPPGSIPATERTRMLNSLTLDQMDVYSYLDADGRSAYEDDWLRSHPVGGSTNSYRLAEDILGVASGTFAAVLASNDRAQSEALAARTREAIAAIQERRDATTLPLEIRRLDLQIAVANNQAMAMENATRQGGINTQTYVIGGVVAVALAAAAFAYAASQSRKNPVVDRSNRRVFIPLELLTSKELEAYQRSKRRAA